MLIFLLVIIFILTSAPNRVLAGAYRLWLMVLIPLLLCFGSIALTHAWEPTTRSFIADEAFLALPKEFQEGLLPFKEEIKLSAAIEGLNANTRQKSAWVRFWNMTFLMISVNTKLTTQPTDWKAVAYDMGLLCNYIAELNDPLNGNASSTVDNGIHDQYDADVSAHVADISFSLNGVSFDQFPLSKALNSSAQAGWYYRTIIDAYTVGAGFDDAKGVAAINLNRAAQDVVDIWSTICQEAVSVAPSLGLRINTSKIIPGDAHHLYLSALAGKSRGIAADLYIALYHNQLGMLYLGEDGKFNTEPTPFRTNWSIEPVSNQEIFSSLIGTDFPQGRYDWYAVLTKSGANLFSSESWLSAPAHVSFEVAPFALVQLTQLTNETYLFSAHQPNALEDVLLPLRRWDIMFFGHDESQPFYLIPGKFSHIAIYLGRDRSGVPYGAEMTIDFDDFQISNLRILRLPEFMDVINGSSQVHLPLVTINPVSYGNRWAKRLDPHDLARVVEAENSILWQVQTDIENKFPYQLEISWSGKLTDKQIFLVDDGRAGGATCTDYWLTLFEDYANVCIHGSRMTAGELEDYFLYDPYGMLAQIPDKYNPFFPLHVTVGDILKLGFYAVNPLPHVFPCDETSETGLPIPNQLMDNSPELFDIDPVQIGIK
jgi:hypothetical protein